MEEHPQKSMAQYVIDNVVDNVDNVAWRDLELSIQCTIFRSLRQSHPSEIEVALSLGLNKLELDSILEKINLRTIYPATSDHIRQYCEIAGWNAIKSGTAGLMDSLSDYLLFAGSYEDTTEAGVAKGKAFLRQRNLDDRLLSDVQDDDTNQPYFSHTNASTCIAESLCNIKGCHDRKNGVDPKSGGNTDPYAEGVDGHDVEDQYQNVHANHEPSRFASHFQHHRFPKAVRARILDKDPRQLNEIENWLAYGDELCAEPVTQAVKRSTTHENYVNAGGKKLVPKASTELYPRYLHHPFIINVLQLHGKHPVHYTGTGAGSVQRRTANQINERANLSLHYCHNIDGDRSQPQHAHTEDQAATLGPLPTTPPRPAWSPISVENGSQTREERLDMMKQNRQSNSPLQSHENSHLTSTANASLRLLAKTTSLPIQQPQQRNQRQNHATTFTMATKIAKPRMKRGPYKKTRERLERELARRMNSTRTLAPNVTTSSEGEKTIHGGNSSP